MVGRPHLTIPGLMTVIVALAIGFAALRTASRFWYVTTYSFTVIVLLWSVIAARFGRPGARAFWYGFAVFGWAFFLLGSNAWFSPFEVDQESGGLNPNLLTSKLILFLVPRLRKDTNDLELVSQITANTIGIAHMLISLTLALSGGLVAAWLRRRPSGAGPGRPQRDALGALILLAAIGLGVAFTSWGDDARFTAPFFPQRVLREDLTGISRFEVRWYSKHLAAMEEPPLWPSAGRDSETRIYRLLWLPSFHHPVCVRVDHASQRIRLHARVLDGAGGYDPGQIAIDREVALGHDQWLELERLVTAAAFWEMPTRTPKDAGGCDGDQLIVEGVKGDTYHVVDRWEPKGAYETLCHYLLGLTGLDFETTWGGYHSTASSDSEPDEQRRANHPT